MVVLSQTTATRALNNVFGRQGAGVIFVDLDLHSGVPNFERTSQYLGRLDQKVVSGMAGRHDDVAGHGCLGGADGPDMKIMHLGHAWKTQKKLPHRFDIGTARRSIERAWR